MKFCEENCGKDTVCPYDICPFAHRYTEKDEVVSGYRYVGDPNLDRALDWAVEFKKNPNCNTCPFVIDEVDNGVGIQRNCDFVCKMDIDDILKEAAGYCL